MKTLANLGCPADDKTGTTIVKKLESEKAKVGGKETGSGKITCTLANGTITVQAGGDPSIKSSNRN